MLGDTICAISTALQDKAISIIRLSGDDAIDIVTKIFSKDLNKVDSNTINYGFIKDDGKKIDEVLVSVFRAPHTFTRENIVEINCHGGVYITRKILSLCIANGARPAGPGEFTQRAYLNGRIDLTQAEAINDMINAKTSRSATLAINGIKGDLKKLIDPLIEELLAIIAHIEVNIDYPEYDDIEQLTNEIVLPKAISLQEKIAQCLTKAESGRIMKDGVKTVIVGKPNAGKSSLLNALLQEDKAIVTDIEGTTRDLVEGKINLENVTLNLIDTAGLRDTNDKIEKIGIEKTYQVLEEAELVIVVIDASKPLDMIDEELLALTADKNRIVVYNKSDLIKETMNDKILISASNKEVGNLINEINNRYQKHLIALDEPTLNNDRQIGLVNKANNEIINAINSLKMGLELDLVTIDLQSCYLSLKEILGEVSRDDLLDTIFTNFCLGK